MADVVLDIAEHSSSYLHSIWSGDLLDFFPDADDTFADEFVLLGCLTFIFVAANRVFFTHALNPEQLAPEPRPKRRPSNLHRTRSNTPSPVAASAPSVVFPEPPFKDAHQPLSEEHIVDAFSQASPAAVPVPSPLSSASTAVPTPEPRNLCEISSVSPSPHDSLQSSCSSACSSSSIGPFTPLPAVRFVDLPSKPIPSLLAIAAQSVAKFSFDSVDFYGAPPHVLMAMLPAALASQPLAAVIASALLDCASPKMLVSILLKHNHNAPLSPQDGLIVLKGLLDRNRNPIRRPYSVCAIDKIVSQIVRWTPTDRNWLCTIVPFARSLPHTCPTPSASYCPAAPRLACRSLLGSAPMPAFRSTSSMGHSAVTSMNTVFSLSSFVTSISNAFPPIASAAASVSQMLIAPMFDEMYQAVTPPSSPPPSAENPLDIPPPVQRRKRATLAPAVAWNVPSRKAAEHFLRFVGLRHTQYDAAGAARSRVTLDTYLDDAAPQNELVQPADEAPELLEPAPRAAMVVDLFALALQRRQRKQLRPVN
eukprot:TRINITY_DN305_c0_g1_i1.p1 TRINITY_DN305_c0_g1~~TRINITY_DN305_c0_g1_i1.p1  ORF type:complete len:535 (+),score=86.50 TRINITY_DN305_c0_g1_i1:282-1886(+)